MIDRKRRPPPCNHMDGHPCVAVAYLSSESAAGQMRRAMPALIRKPLADSKKRHARAHAADRSAAEALGTVHE